MISSILKIILSLLIYYALGDKKSNNTCLNNFPTRSEITGNYIGYGIIPQTNKPLEENKIADTYIEIKINYDGTLLWSGYNVNVRINGNYLNINQNFKLFHGFTSPIFSIYSIPNPTCMINGFFTFLQTNYDFNLMDNKVYVDNKRKFVNPPNFAFMLDLSDCKKYLNNTGHTKIFGAMQKLPQKHFQQETNFIGTILFIKSLLFAIANIIFMYKHATIMNMRKLSSVFTTILIVHELVESCILLSMLELESFNLITLSCIFNIFCFFIIYLRLLVLQLREQIIEKYADESEEVCMTKLYKYVRYYILIIISATYALFKLCQATQIWLFLFSFVFIPQIIKTVVIGTGAPSKMWYNLAAYITIIVYPTLFWSNITIPYSISTFEIVNKTLNNAISVPWFNGAMAISIPDNSFRLFKVMNQNYFIYYLMVCSLIAQLFLLFLQSFWSPRIFVPKIVLMKYLKPVYLYEKDANTLLKLNKSSPISPALFECVICVSTVNINKSNCVITPCEHFFHRDCLYQWMNVKLQCPTCRANLPPC